MPTWNGEAFVAQALDSVLEQSHGNFELLVVDDASTDRTLDVVSLSRDARIEVHRHRKRRLASSVKAFSAAIGMDRWRASVEPPDARAV